MRRPRSPLFSPPVPLLLALLLGGAAGAAETPLPGTATLSPGVTLHVLEGPSTADRVDESGLRYYVATGDMEAAEAELLRLKILHPAWRPPVDLLENPWGGVDERAIWQRIEAGQYEEARAESASLQRKFPAWVPSPDLLRELERGELRRQIAAWGQNGDWKTIRQELDKRPEAIGCTTADLAWSYAEALARTGARSDSGRVYETLIAGCADFSIRLASLQKAGELLPRDLVAALVRKEAEHPHSDEDTQHFDLVERDLLRGRVASLAAGKATETATAISEMEQDVNARRDAKAAVLLGWWHYQKRRYQNAATWFGSAGRWDGTDAEAAEGMILSQFAMGNRTAADALIAQWRSRSPRIAQLAERLKSRGRSAGSPVAVAAKALEEGRFAECLDRTADIRGKPGFDAGAALVRAWCLLQQSRPSEARDWFNLALNQPNPTDQVRRDANFGLALLALRRGDLSGFAGLSKRSGAGSQHDDDLFAQLLEKEADRAYKAKRYQEFLRLLDQRERFGALPRYLLLLKGWSLYHTGRGGEAYSVFQNLDRLSSTPDTRQAMEIMHKGHY